MDGFVKSVGSTEEALQLHQRLRHVLGSRFLYMATPATISSGVAIPELSAMNWMKAF